LIRLRCGHGYQYRREIRLRITVAVFHQATGTLATSFLHLGCQREGTMTWSPGPRAYVAILIRAHFERRNIKSVMPRKRRSPGISILAWLATGQVTDVLMDAKSTRGRKATTRSPDKPRVNGIGVNQALETGSRMSCEVDAGWRRRTRQSGDDCADVAFRADPKVSRSGHRRQTATTSRSAAG